MSAPALDSPRCVGSVFAKRLRVTRLHTGGTLDPGTQNKIVSSGVVSIGSTPNVQTGDELSQRNGGGDICVSVTEPDVITRYDLTTALCQLDAPLLEMTTGGRVLFSGGEVVGFAVPTFASSKPIVCVEAWTQAQEGATQAVEDGASLWVHWVWPRVEWTIGATTLERGVLNVNLTGKAVENPSMGHGPEASWPEAITEAQAWFLDDELPDAVCGYQSLVVAGSAS